MDFSGIIDNPQVKGILEKIGVDEAKQKQVLNAATDLIKNKALSDPQALSSLLSSSPNSDKDEEFQAGLKLDFLDDLVKKVGISPEIAEKITGSLPQILSSFTSSKGFDLESLTGIIDVFTGGGDTKKGKSGGGGFMDLISGFLGKKK